MSISGGPDIIKGGLVADIDAGNPKSYPRTGTTLKDLSGNGNDAELVNGPTFYDVNKGTIAFDGWDDFVWFGSKFNYTTENFSMSMWANFYTLATADQGPPLFFNGSYLDYGYYSIVNPSGVVFFCTNQPGAIQCSTTPPMISINTWYNLTFVRSSTSNVGIYVNGKFAGGNANNHISPTSSPQDFILNSYNYYWSGGTILSSFSVYDRALSEAEVLQNYNSTKGRYNL
jgi:hypothetical protein